MGRPSKFEIEQIMDAAAELLAEVGPARLTVAMVAQRLGAPTGSIYHRFESRDLLLARLWVRTVRRAQEGFLAALTSVDPQEAAQEAALHMPRWSREHLAEATLLLLYRRHDLAEKWPSELGDELASLNAAMEQAVREFTQRAFGELTRGRLQAVSFALIDVPYAATRRFLLAGKPPSARTDALVLQTCRCILFADEGAAARVVP